MCLGAVNVKYGVAVFFRWVRFPFDTFFPFYQWLLLGDKDVRHKDEVFLKVYQCLRGALYHSDMNDATATNVQNLRYSFLVSQFNSPVRVTRPINHPHFAR